MKLWEKMKSFVMQCSHVARSRWREWSKRKRVTVCTLSSLMVLIAGIAIFCLTVPLFYWWPDEGYIPNTSNVKAYFTEVIDDDRVQERDYGGHVYASQFHYMMIENFRDYSCPYTFACIQVEQIRNLNIYQPYQAHHSELKNRMYGEKASEPDAVWTADCIIEATVTNAFFDPSVNPLKPDERIRIYVCGERKNEEDSKLCVGGQYLVWMQKTDRMFYNTPEEYFTGFYSVIADYHIETPLHLQPIENGKDRDEDIYKIIEYSLGIDKSSFLTRKSEWEEYLRYEK